jgi:diguanylate cyclase (GGDEF)-like protein
LKTAIPPSPPKAPAPPERRRLVVLLGVILAFGFLATTLASFFASRGSLRESIVGSELPLIADNIYSEIQKDLIRPILISSTMASDTFLRDWVIAGEADVERITRYLKEIKTRFGAFTSFFISERTRVYYHADGVLKTVSEQEPRDVWYFRARSMAPDYEINVDPDLANADAMTIFINYRVFDYAGKYIGIAGVGLTVNAVQDLIRKYRERFAREIYFVDKSGQVVLSETPGDAGKLGDRPGIGAMADQLLSGGQQAVQYEVGGKARFVNVRYVPELQWFLFVEKDDGKSTAGIVKTLYLNLLVCLIAIVLVTSITSVFVGRYQAQLERVATTDPLTGLANRQAYDILMTQALKEADRGTGPLSIAMIDIDNFKQANDRFGHIVGDEVLRSVAAVIRASIREADILCRWGGEEFLLVLKNCRRDAAIEVGEKIREAVDGAAVAAGGELVRVTISIGVAERFAREPEPALLGRADAALRAAKAAGKNRVRADGVP